MYWSASDFSAWATLPTPANNNFERVLLIYHYAVGGQQNSFSSPGTTNQEKTYMTIAKPFLILSALTCGVALGAQTNGTNPLASSRVFPYEQMTIKTAANGSEGRSVASGTLATGEAVGLHESMQPVGTPPNPEHRIQHSELIVVQQGILEFQHDGKAEQAGPGSIIYVALGTMHTVKNVGNVPAKYVVIQIGGDTGK